MNDFTMLSNICTTDWCRIQNVENLMVHQAQSNHDDRHRFQDMNRLVKYQVY